MYFEAQNECAEETAACARFRGTHVLSFLSLVYETPPLRVVRMLL